MFLFYTTIMSEKYEFKFITTITIQFGKSFQSFQS